MIPALLAQIGLPLIARLAGAGLETLDNPVAAAAAGALREVDGVLRSTRRTGASKRRRARARRKPPGAKSTPRCAPRHAPKTLMCAAGGRPSVMR